MREVTYELISAARLLGVPVTVAVIGGDLDSLDVNRVGVDDIVHVPTEQAEFENDVYQFAVERLIDERQPQVVLIGSTVNAMGYAGAVAAKLGLGFATDVFQIAREGESIVATRSFYGGKVHGEIEFPLSAGVLLLSPDRLAGGLGARLGACHGTLAEGSGLAGATQIVS